MPAEAELEAAKENLRNLFFSLAFDPDNQEMAEQADEAMRKLDHLLAAAGAAGTGAR